MIIYPLAELHAAWALERKKQSAKLLEMHKRGDPREAFKQQNAFCTHLRECTNLIAHAQWMVGDETAQEGVTATSRLQVVLYLQTYAKKQAIAAREAQQKMKRNQLKAAARPEWEKAKLEYEHNEEQRLQRFIQLEFERMQDGHILYPSDAQTMRRLAKARMRKHGRDKYFLHGEDSFETWFWDRHRGRIGDDGSRIASDTKRSRESATG